LFWSLVIELDVHKDSITIAIAEAERNSELRLFGSVVNDLGRWKLPLPHPQSPSRRPTEGRL
jgi:hypothetical protein